MDLDDLFLFVWLCKLCVPVFSSCIILSLVSGLHYLVIQFLVFPEYFAVLTSVGLFSTLSNRYISAGAVSGPELSVLMTAGFGKPQLKPAQ